MRSLVRTALPLALLLAAAGLCAVVSNALARPERRLSWVSAAPPSAPAAVPLPPAPPPPAPFPVLERPAPVRPDPKTPPMPAPAPASSTPFPVQPGQPIREIDSQQALAAFRAKVPFLDARRSEEYTLGHVKGAWSLPIWEGVLETRITEFEAAAMTPPEGPLVLYCSGGSCEDSHLLASKLFQLGYRNLLVYRDGYPDWTSQGRPTTAGGGR